MTRRAYTLSAAAERRAGAQREIPHRRASGCSSRAGRVPTEGSPTQCGNEPHRREQ